MAICLSHTSYRAPRSAATRRSRRSPQSSRTHVQRLLLRKRVNAAFATKYANRVQPDPTPATTFHLPRTLPRPPLSEVNTASIWTAYPELAGVTPEYIREHLTLTGPQLLAAAACVKAHPPRNSLPGELQVVMNDMLTAACPTHMLAVFSNSPPTTRRKVTLFPTHHLVLAAHCINLPSIPLSTTTSTKAKLPVVPLRLPSPETFNLLQTYLYTKHTTSLLADLRPSENTSDILSLNRLAMRIHGIWRNSCVLGVVDEQLFDVIDQAWEEVVGAIEQARS